MERLDFSDDSKYNAIEASIHLNRYLSAKKFINGKKVLDAACGEGYGSFLMKQWGASEVIGIDISEDALNVAQKKFAGKGVSFINHTVEVLPFEDNSFDVVVSYETIEHLDCPEKFLAELRRVAKNDGTILVSCPNDPYYYKNETISNPYHKRKYTWYDFQELAKQYLGDNVIWYFGFATNGYITIPQNECKYPERDNLNNIKMTELLNEKYIEISSYVLPDRYINDWNANYYLGVWGKGNNMEVNTVVSFPREIFIEPDDPVFADIAAWNRNHKKEIKDLEEQLLCEQEERTQLQEKHNHISRKLEICEQEYLKSEEERLDLTEELRVSRVQNERTSSLLEVANIEKRYLWERISQYEAKMKNIEDTLIRQREDSEKALFEKENIINNLSREACMLQTAVDEFERYKNSVSYKLMQPVRKIWNLLRFWK